MVDAGYFLKHVEAAPEHLLLHGVREVCSVSGHISRGPKDWLQHWLHNDLGLFNTPEDALRVIGPEPHGQYRLFAYRIHPEIFTPTGRIPFEIPARVTPISADFVRLGFDCVNKTLPDVLGFECSPLSCNDMAAEIAVNEYCLLADFSEALTAAERFANEQPEPGVYYVVEVLERR